MYSFYIIRGHSLEYLEGLPGIVKMFFIQAMNEYYREKAIMFGADEKELDKKEEELKLKAQNK